MKILLLLVISLFISNSAYSKIDLKDKYYIYLTKLEREEINLIKMYYHKYDKEFKVKAYERYNEIKSKIRAK